MLTDITVLQTKLATARERERRARATTARLSREIQSVDRKRAAHQKIALGAALLRAVEGDGARHVAGLRRLILPCITRDTDRAALAGTAFDPVADDEAGSGGVA